MSQQAVDLLVQEHEQHPDNPILFPSSRTGGYWSPDAVSRINRKLLKNAGIEEHVRFHDLRHTCASVLIQNRVPLIEVQQWLGHSTLETTADLYAHLEYETKLASAETLKKI